MWGAGPLATLIVSAVETNYTTSFCISIWIYCTFCGKNFSTKCNCNRLYIKNSVFSKTKAIRMNFLYKLFCGCFTKQSEGPLTPRVPMEEERKPLKKWKTKEDLTGRACIWRLDQLYRNIAYAMEMDCQDKDELIEGWTMEIMEMNN